MSTQTYLPLKFNFFSEFGHFMLKRLENVKFSYVSRRKIVKYPYFWGMSPAYFSTGGGGRVPLPPPALDAHGSIGKNWRAKARHVEMTMTIFYEKYVHCPYPVAFRICVDEERNTTMPVEM